MDAGKYSPLNTSYEVSQRNLNYHSVTSPGGSDGNHYQSPLISPGHWNTSSPSYNYNTVSPQSNTSFQGTPSSTTSEVRSQPPSTPSSFHPPSLPTELGNHDTKTDSRTKAQQMDAINKRFMEKSSMDKERERIANRRVQSMMVEATRRRSQSFGKNEAKSFLILSGAEAFATSSRQEKKEPMVMEDVNGSVNDFKCEKDLDREWAAKKHALRIVTRLDIGA